MLRSLLVLNKCACYDARTWEKFESLGMPPEAFMEEAPAVWSKLGITDRNMDVMKRAVSSGWAERELERCDRLGVSIITCRDANYPAPLLEIRDAPLLLYVWGSLGASAGESIAVVGTRRCSSYASGVAKEMGARAGACGCRVVSGGAKGIDGAAHTGCLEGGGVTTAVLGTGVDQVYPVEHREMFARVRERGALCSEYPMGSKGESWHFPRRNRIIVGLSSKVVVAEAPIKSGAMITARLAAEESREVWAVPGRIGDERCAGSNRLIFDGAMPLIDLDFLFESGSHGRQRELFADSDAASAGRDELRLSENERVIASLLARREDNTIDNLAGEAKMSAADVFKIVSILDMRGIVFQSGSGRYRLRD